MRRLALLLAACSHAAPAVENHPTDKPAPVAAELPGPRAAIVHERFLYKPISVINPTNEPIIVSTATDSIMLLTIPLTNEVTIMLSSDGKLGDDLGPGDTGETIVASGKDARLVWRITQAASGMSASAINLPTGVYCAFYADHPVAYTRPQIDQMLATCRDIRFATEAELADHAHV